MLVLAHDDVVRMLPMRECIEVVDEALRTLAREDAVQPLRHMVWLPDRSGLLGLMPGYLGSPATLGLKVVAVMPGNQALGRDSHQGIVAIFDPKHGETLAIMDAAAITAIRTAAASAVATRALAREDAGDLAILGSGVQARTHLEAMGAVRRLKRIRVWSRDPERARRFAESSGGSTGGAASDSRGPDRTGQAASGPGAHEHEGPPIEVAPTVRAAVEGADLICTTTGAREPILEGAWLAPGTHVNAVGACFPTVRELDTASVVRSRLFVDRRESTLNEAGEFLIPKKEGAIGDDHIVGEIGALLLGRVQGRRSREEITLFKSLGIAIEDLASAHHLYRKAMASGSGARVAFGPHDR